MKKNYRKKIIEKFYSIFYNLLTNIFDTLNEVQKIYLYL